MQIRFVDNRSICMGSKPSPRSLAADFVLGFDVGALWDFFRFGCERLNVSSRLHEVPVDIRRK